MVIGMLIGVANAILAIFFSVWWSTVIRIGLSNLEGSARLSWYNGSCLLWIASVLVLFLLFSWLMVNFINACSAWKLPEMALYLTASFVVASGIWALSYFLISNLIVAAGGDFALQQHGELLLLLWLGSMYLVGGIYAGGQKVVTTLLSPLIISLLLIEKMLLAVAGAIGKYRNNLMDASRRGGEQR